MVRGQPVKLVQKTHSNESFVLFRPSEIFRQNIMTTIRVTCPDCGDNELAVNDLKARVLADTDHAEYRFRCADCGMVSVKPLEPRTLELLASAGVHISTWTLPAELSETHDGLTITHNDILDFHALLSKDDELAAALESLDAG